MYNPNYGQYATGLPVHYDNKQPPPPPQMPLPPAMPPPPVPPVNYAIPPPNMDDMGPASPHIEMMQSTMMKVHYPPQPMHYPPPPQHPPVPITVTPQIPGPTGASTPTSHAAPNYRDFSASETSFTGIGTSFETPKRKKASALQGPKSKFYCDLCKIDLGEEEVYEKHCQGFMHTQKVAAKEGRKPLVSKQRPMQVEDSKPKAIKNLREKYPDQYCEVCDTTMTSESVFRQHVQGIRHQKNLQHRAQGGYILRGRGSRRLPKEQQQAEANIRCQKLLEAADEPLVGLQYMTEFTKNNPAVEERYVCDLCNGKCDPRTLVPHIVGSKHRYAYLKHEHPNLLEPHAEALKSMRKAEKTNLMRELALQVVIEIEKEPRKMKAKVEIDPFYNPNQEAKKVKKVEGGTAGTGTGGAVKRPQNDAGEDGNMPPPKRAPKAKVTPNWGGPDPQKQMLKAHKSDDEGDGYHGNNNKSPDKEKSPNKASLPQNLNEIVSNLSMCLVNNEQEASMALQVSNTLTQALLQYRLRNLAEASEAPRKN